MEQISGDTSKHDTEFDKVYWEQTGSALKKIDIRFSNAGCLNIFPLKIGLVCILCFSK